MFNVQQALMPSVLSPDLGDVGQVAHEQGQKIRLHGLGHIG
jgi:hypothetical protein